MSDHFAILQDYPKEGPPVPEREKVHRGKNKHESGTGRRDKEKREGRGQGNWGDPIKDQIEAEADEDIDQDEIPEDEKASPQPDYVPAKQIFANDD